MGKNRLKLSKNTSWKYTDEMWMKKEQEWRIGIYELSDLDQTIF